MEAWKLKIKELVENMNYYLYDITFGPREGELVLSVEIDHDDGITIDDCVKVSDVISTYLDEADPIDSSYGLEVTSAGAERELRTYDEIKRAHGHYVYIKTFDQIYEGTLEDVTESDITIREKNKQKTTIFMTDIELIRMAIDF